MIIIILSHNLIYIIITHNWSSLTYRIFHWVYNLSRNRGLFYNARVCILTLVFHKTSVWIKFNLPSHSHRRSIHFYILFEIFFFLTSNCFCNRFKRSSWLLVKLLTNIIWAIILILLSDFYKRYVARIYKHKLLWILCFGLTHTFTNNKTILLLLLLLCLPSSCGA